ncbi:MAG TPA: Ig-like domain-containing protein [Burkholderiales bacterium]|nr:Ig-like domain-containing protein [Burkholderiales bacterium]
MGEKASVALLFVALGLFEPISAAWAKKDKVEVTLTAPAAGALYNAPAAVVLSAIAQSKQKNHLIAKVEFFQGTSLVGSVTGPRAGDQYTLSWTGVAAGTYSLTARATNDKGDADLSDPVSITVNALPSVSLTSPGSNAAFKAPANIPLAVQAADADGSIANVDYFYGTTLITSLSAPPYSFVWIEVPQGTYALTARVTDNLGGAMTSVAVNVTVNAAEAKLYYIHVDHLNTPRLIADQNQRTVWRDDNTEPFGDSAADENPSSLGVFEFPMTLSLYYRDRETGNFYATQRDTYNPSIGRFPQSDPIGLLGGINTYAYVWNDPLRFTDPLGLATYMCTRRLHNVPFRSGPLYHQYTCVGNSSGGFSCGGLAPTGNMFDSPGMIESDEMKAKSCQLILDDNDCVEKCIRDTLNQPLPNYSVDLSRGENCHTYANAAVNDCVAKCKVKQK